ncbi:endo-1,4-beta-xylanase [candidate division KSB1 bacterium]|nr:endo-1,4-beta-xylanase [candidate division KSB1 bacterium]
MRNYYFIFLSTLIFFHLHAQTPPEPSGRRYRDIVEEKFPGNSIIIGGTTGAWAFGTRTGLLMDREFNYVTPENDFKQWAIHPDPFTWTWTSADAWVRHIANNGQILRMHCPISPQCSQWAQTDTRTAEELEVVMREFMRAVCERYNNTPGIVSLDVVNEIVQGGTWKRNETGTGGWETPWYKIGRDDDAKRTPLYIRYAFEIATEHATNLKLILNHHEDPNALTSWDLIKTTIGYVRNLGLRVDGIGWQAHVNNGWATTSNLNRLRDLIDWAQKNDLEFHVTEASVWIEGSHTASALEKQAETYSKIVEVLLEKRPGGKVGWNTWHIDDGHGWQYEKIPSIFDAEYTAKPAYYAIQTVLENAPADVTDSTKNVRTFQLYQNYPNPFNPSTTISYTLAKDAYVNLTVYNTLGHKIATVLDGYRSAGEYTVEFNAHHLSAGLYFYALTSDGTVVGRKKMLIIK